MNHWMFRCKDVSGLISRSMDETLPLRIRLGIKIHVMMCYLCSRYQKQLVLIRRAVSKFSVENESDFPVTPLPHSAVKKIKDHIKGLE